MKKVEDNDFEQLLLNSANELRMHPSRGVWKAINRRLHQRKRVYAAAALLLLIGLFTTLYNLPDKVNNPAPAVAQQEQTRAAAQSQAATPAPGTQPARSTTEQTRFTNSREPVARRYSPSTNNINNIARPAITNRYTNRQKQFARTRITTPAGKQENTVAQTSAPVNYTRTETENSATTTVNNTSTAEVVTAPSQTNNLLTGSGTEITGKAPVEITTNTNTEPGSSNSSFTGVAKTNISKNFNSEELAEKTAATVNLTKKNNLAENMLVPKILTGNLEENGDQKNGNNKNSDLVTITPKQRRFTTEFYLTPSISYRKLTDSRDKNDPGAFTQSELDKAVYHKPSVGFEAGVSWHYRIYDRLRAKIGLQLNYNRFNMKASKVPQAEIATIALYGNNRDRNNPSNLRASDDRNAVGKWLENKNIQVSVPVGIEAVLANSAKTSLNMGITAQPSYLLSDKNYLLSTDLRNYLLSTDLYSSPSEPSLTRRFNMNIGLEAFFAFNRAGLRWHVGPQLRYQLFSTYNKIYPIRENLLDYGFKIGISKPF